MARTARTYEAPKTMTLDGDGIEEVSVSRYLERAKKNEDGTIKSGTDRLDTFKVKVPKDGSGIATYQKAIQAAGIEDAKKPILIAVRNHIIEQAWAARKEADSEKVALPDVSSLIPDFPAVRITDEMEAKAAQFKNALVSGQIKLDDPDVMALFGKLMAK